jgi:hypothetical protein
MKVSNRNEAGGCRIMWDWYLGQAGFGEQIEVYGESFWRQVGVTMLWTSVAILAVLMFVAAILVLTRRAAANKEMEQPSEVEEAPRKADTPAGATPADLAGRTGARAA